MRYALIVCLLIAVCGFAQEMVNAPIEWVAPTNNLDGTPLTDLLGYEVYRGTNEFDYFAVTNIGDATATNCVWVNGAVFGVTNYYALKSYNAEMTFSPFSGEACWYPHMRTQPGGVLGLVPSASGEFVWAVRVVDGVRVTRKVPYEGAAALWKGGK